MIKVLIADDHTIVRHGLKQILNGDPQIDVVCEAGNGNDVLNFVRESDVDVVVLDITMSGRNGLETLKELRRSNPGLPVLVLSMHPSDQYAVRVLRAGAAGYITKESAPDELVMAIKKAFRGASISVRMSPNCLDRISNSAKTTSRTNTFPTANTRFLSFSRPVVP